jgi:hypothetical protein
MSDSRTREQTASTQKHQTRELNCVHSLKNANATAINFVHPYSRTASASPSCRLDNRQRQVILLLKHIQLPPFHLHLLRTSIQSSIKPHQRLRSDQIPTPQQLRNVDIQWAVRLASRAQQLLNRLERADDAVGRRP